MGLEEFRYDDQDVILPYLFSLPENQSEAVDGRLPLIFFLHGAGERGQDLNLIRHYGIPQVVRKNRDFPFITLSPQCPPHSYWEDFDSVLFALLDDIMARYPVDPQRVYLTGLSMGGHGTWILGLEQPKRFAALAPVCPPFPNLPDLSRRLAALKEKPIWIFHGGRDDIVPIEHSEMMVKALRQVGNHVKFSVFPEAHHDSWTHAYATKALYEWFLSHRLGETQNDVSERQ